MNHRVEIQPKRARLDWLLYTVVALALAAITIDGVFGPHGFIASYRLRLQLQQAEQETQKLDQENQQFAKQAQQLKTNPAAIERVARERMGLVKPGQLLFKVPSPPPASQNGSTGR